MHSSGVVLQVIWLSLHCFRYDCAFPKKWFWQISMTKSARLSKNSLTGNCKVPILSCLYASVYDIVMDLSNYKWVLLARFILNIIICYCSLLVFKSLLIIVFSFTLHLSALSCNSVPLCLNSHFFTSLVRTVLCLLAPQWTSQPLLVHFCLKVHIMVLDVSCMYGRVL